MFLTHFGNKANATEGRTISAEGLYHQRNHSTHKSGGVSVMSLSARFQHMASADTDHLCQIVLSQKLSRKFEKWCRFSSYVKVKSCKMRPACNSNH
jgi:hypothetical protein